MVAIGTGVAALGAGAYALLGPNGKKNQQKAKVWIAKMEKAVEKKAMPAMKKATKAAKKTVKKVEKKAMTKIMKAEKNMKKAVKVMKKMTKGAKAKKR